MSSLHDHDQRAQHALLHLPPDEGGGLIFIEQIAKTPLKTCKNPARPTLITSSASERLAVVWRPDCNMWNCPDCGERKRKRLVALGYAGAASFINSGRRLGFVTITSHEKLGAAHSMKVWPKAWDKLRKRLQYAVPDTAWLFVPELHQNGRMHAHGLVVDAPDKKWWKDQARACGFGYQDDMQEAENLRVVGYLAKYTAKTLENDKFPKGTRRYRASQGWPKLEQFMTGGDLTTRKMDYEKTVQDQTAHLRADGYTVVQDYDGLIWSLFRQTQK